MQTSLKGKTILVTGATNGIGLVTARELARMGGQVTIVSRKADKCAAVAEKIEAQTGNPVEVIPADLSTLAGIMQAAADFKQRHTRLHILVNNAGGMFIKRILTADGYEYTFALNHLGFFLLTNLLLEVIKSSAPSRIVNVSSDAHYRARMNFDDLQGEKRYRGLEAYGQSKLANLLFTYELARRLEGSNVTVNAVHPGFVATGFARNNGPIYNIGTRIAGLLFGRKPEKGAETPIYLAVSPEVEGVSGKFFHDCRPIRSSQLSYDRTSAEKLWQVSLEMTAKAM
jgi:NAD(P)-dependent dehydrogenase (short-subunit alcohol dehydrogenase family)